MAEPKRIFVAILLPPAVEAHLDDVIDPLRTTLPELRWVRAANWHLTLEFLGACGPHEVERQLSRWEERAMVTSTMRLSLASGGAFPSSIRTKVLWTGVAGDVDALRKLAGPDQEPHVTVARSRQPRDLTGVIDTLSTYAGPAWNVTHVALVESRLRSRDDGGPRYVPLEHFALAG